MYRGTTPTLTLTFPEGTDFTGATAYVSLSNEKKVEVMRITGNNLDIVDNVISLYLSQEQTLTLPSVVLIQVNWTYGTGERACSNIVRFDTKRNLINEVL